MHMDCLGGARRLGWATAVVFASLLASRAARAEEVAAQPTADTAGMEEDENGVLRKKREPLLIGLDFTLGYGNYGAVVEAVPPSGNTNRFWLFDDSTQIRTASFVLLGHYRFKGFGIGARFPLISAHISDNPALPSTLYPSGSTATFPNDIFTTGNLEVSMDMPRRLSPQVRYIPQLALTFPTSPGSTPPYTNAQLLAAQCAGPGQSLATCTPTLDSSLADRYGQYAAGHAAAFARGGEDDALYFNWRLGITPKVGFDMLFGHTRIQPYIKIPIMFGLEQSPAAEEPVRIEAVAGVRVAQEIGPLHLGVRLVGMVPIAARSNPPDGMDVNSAMLSVWPEIKLQITPSASFWVSGMIPLAGDFNVFTDGKNGSFNAGLSASF